MFIILFMLQKTCFTILTAQIIAAMCGCFCSLKGKNCLPNLCGMRFWLPHTTVPRTERLDKILKSGSIYNLQFDTHVTAASSTRLESLTATHFLYVLDSLKYLVDLFMGFNVPKQHWDYKRCCSRGLCINFNHLKFLNVHINLIARMFLHFAYINI